MWGGGKGLRVSHIICHARRLAPCIYLTYRWSKTLSPGAEDVMYVQYSTYVMPSLIFHTHMYVCM